MDGPLETEGKSEEVKQAMLKRRQSLAAAQFEAREELRRQTQSKLDEELAFEKLHLSHGPNLKQWSEEFGKKKNIRALLAGMDRVMWPTAKWGPISIGDLLDPKKVKRAYYKAARAVHPDK